MIIDAILLGLLFYLAWQSMTYGLMLTAVFGLSYGVHGYRIVGVPSGNGKDREKYTGRMIRRGLIGAVYILCLIPLAIVLS